MGRGVAFGFDISPARTAYWNKNNFVVDIAAGDNHNVVITKNNDVISWGANAHCNANVTDALIMYPKILLSNVSVSYLSASNHTLFTTREKLYMCKEKEGAILVKTADHGEFLFVATRGSEIAAIHGSRPLLSDQMVENLWNIIIGVISLMIIDLLFNILERKQI
jgi:alpha-tubulin suppressor-like RCC1 family protein